MKIYISQQSSPQSSLASINHKKTLTVSHQNQSAFDLSDTSNLLKENKQALNLSSLAILDQSAISKPHKPRYDKENRKSFTSFSTKKLEQRPEEQESQDQIGLMVLDTVLMSQLSILTCQICGQMGQLIQLCGCQYIHAGCMMKKQEQLQLDLKEEDIKSKLLCSNCNNYLQIHIYSTFNSAQCRKWKTLLRSFILVSIISICFSLLMAFLVNNKEFVFIHPEVFVLIIAFCLLSFISLVSIFISVFSHFQQWQISIREFINLESSKESNLQQILILESLKKK